MTFKTSFKAWAKATAAVLLGLTLVVATPAVAGKGGNSGGGGGGGGNSGNHGGGNSNKGGSKASKSDASRSKTKKSTVSKTKVTKTKTKAAAAKTPAPPAPEEAVASAAPEVEAEAAKLDASTAGKLNGFLHASPQALAKASPNSAIGKVAKVYAGLLGGYLAGPTEEGETAPTIDDVVQALQDAANKPLTPEVIAAVNKKLLATNPDLASNLEAAGKDEAALNDEMNAALAASTETTNPEDTGDDTTMADTEVETDEGSASAGTTAPEQDTADSDAGADTNESEDDAAKIDASAAGKLNGFLHASPQALAHASPNSAIGKVAKVYSGLLGGYLGAGEGETAPSINEVAAALQAASNKPLTPDVIKAVNDKLLSTNPDLAASLEASGKDAGTLANEISAALTTPSEPAEGDDPGEGTETLSDAGPDTDTNGVTIIGGL